MNTKTIVLSVLSLVVISGVGLVVANSAFAYQGDSSVKGPNYTAERHLAMEAAFDNNDYATWLSLMAGRGKATQIVTKDNFSKFAEAHKLVEDGKIAEAAAIRADLGLGQGNRQGKGCGACQAGTTGSNPTMRCGRNLK